MCVVDQKQESVEIAQMLELGQGCWHARGRALSRAFAQKEVKVHQVEFLDKVVGIPLVTRRQISLVRKIQKTRETPQVRYAVKVVDV